MKDNILFADKIYDSHQQNDLNAALNHSRALVKYICDDSDEAVKKIEEFIVYQRSANDYWSLHQNELGKDVWSDLGNRENNTFFFGLVDLNETKKGLANYCNMNRLSQWLNTEDIYFSFLIIVELKYLEECFASYFSQSLYVDEILEAERKNKPMNSYLKSCYKEDKDVISKIKADIDNFCDTDLKPKSLPVVWNMLSFLYHTFLAYAKTNSYKAAWRNCGTQIAKLFVDLNSRYGIRLAKDFVSGLIFDYFLVYDLPNDFGLVSIWKGLFTYAAKGGNVLMPMEFLVGLREQKTSTILSSWARKVLRSSKSSSGEYGRFWIKTIGNF